MKVLEKIKRCVSLVWDFQEIYGEEDIEDFCRNELHTYPQHNEIMEYFKHIAELEKENAGLKELLDCKNCCGLEESEGECCVEFSHFRCKGKAQLTKAKELLKQFLKAKNSEDTYKAEWETEQFLKDSEGK